MSNVRRWLPLVLGLLVAVPASAAPVARRDVCIVAPTGGGSFNTFVLRDVEALAPGRAILLRGLFFTGAQKVAPVHGSAARAMDGSVRLGLFVHSSAASTNDFTVAGVTDTDFVGVLSYDNDGDYRPNGTLAMEPRDCDTITIP